MNKRTILIVLLLVSILGVAVTIFNWIAVRNTLVQILKKQIRKDFLIQLSLDNSNSNQQISQDKFTVALVSDVHNNTDGLTQAVTQINKSNVDFTIGLGDYTNVGTQEEFEPVKKTLSKLSSPYYVLPGDHDLWNGRDKTENPRVFFNEIFTEHPKNQVYKGIHLIYLDNADIYKGVSQTEQEEFVNTLADSKEPLVIIFSHKAIYHPLTTHRMGYINEEKNKEVESQAEEIWKEILGKKNAKIVLISGDLHSFSKYSLSSDKFDAYTIGAITRDKNFQSPRYAILHVGVDNTVRIEDKPLE